VRVSSWVDGGRRRNQIECVVQEDQQCDNNRLSDLDTIDTSKDVDAVRAEDGNG
jgi:hypothetical protein